ncbi:uncharacterized protein B0P05DRAFT_446961, partial [Gilbertella persicaria]|uniref:uncharacterized protein n=1 Tax=Gilbertella persicaria TaxID=101096 RepID=UPI00221F0FBB
IESLLPTGKNKRLFGNLIRSDGFSVGFVFKKRTITEKRLTKQINQVDLILDNFEQHEVDSHYLPIAVDPGRKRVFTAFAGSKTAKETFFLYQGRQRAPEQMVKTFLDGTKKYNKKSRGNKRKRAKIKGKRKKKGNKSGKKDKGKRKMALKTIKTSNFFRYKQKVPLIVSGSGMFGKDYVKMKTVRTGVTGLLYRTLKRRERTGDLLVVDIDEYLMSQICSKCESRTLGGISGARGNSVLVCKTYRTLWQRDINASLN